MFYKAESKQYITEGTAFTVDGVQYPSNWLNLATAEDKAALGLVEVTTAGTPGNDQYFWVSESLVDGVRTYTNTPKELAPVQETALSKIKQAAFSALSGSDWMVSRESEGGTAMAAEWKTWRASVRAATNATAALITAATTVEEIAAVSMELPVDPANVTK